VDPKCAASGGAGRPQSAPPAHAAGQAKRSGVVVFDVDGVIFRGQFIVNLSRKASVATYLAVIRDGFLFNMGRLSLEKLLTRGYRRLRGVPWSTVKKVFKSMPRTKFTAEAIAELRKAGYAVILLSSGVPDELVQDLVRELGADAGAGIEVGRSGDRLNGTVGGILARDEGKVQFVRKYLRLSGLKWEQTIAVGDDDSNLPLMARAGLSIGIHATFGVRKKADFLAERNNLASVVPLILRPTIPQPRANPVTELLRRSIHMTAFMWPFLAAYSLEAAWALLGTASCFYSVSEYLRLNGLSLPAFGAVTRRTIRETERRRFALAPLTLAAGVAFSLAFPAPICFASVGIVAFGDTVGGLVGQFLGRKPLPYSPSKTIEGSLSAFGASAAVASAFLPLPHAVGAALVGSFVESLPLGDWDNFFVPVTTAILVYLTL